MSALGLMIASLTIVGGVICLIGTDVVWELVRLTSPGGAGGQERTDEWEMHTRVLGLAAICFGSALLLGLLSGTIAL